MSSDLRQWIPHLGAHVWLALGALGIGCTWIGRSIGTRIGRPVFYPAVAFVAWLLILGPLITYTRVSVAPELTGSPILGIWRRAAFIAFLSARNLIWLIAAERSWTALRASGAGAQTKHGDGMPRVFKSVQTAPAVLSLALCLPAVLLMFTWAWHRASASWGIGPWFGLLACGYVFLLYGAPLMLSGLSLGAGGAILGRKLLSRPLLGGIAGTLVWLPYAFLQVMRFSVIANSHPVDNILYL